MIINSIEKLRFEIEKANRVLGLNQTVPQDLHRPYIDDVILVDDNGNRMVRELDLIDVWFDSGSMPFAQHHYPSNLHPTNLPEGEASSHKSKPLFHTTSSLNHANLEEKAKAHRKNATETERIMWEHLKGKKMDSFKFRRQHPTLGFIPDFLCLEKRLIVEIDGGYHNEPEIVAYDAYRTKILTENGYKVIRFTNDEVLNDIEAVLKAIHIELCHRATIPKIDTRQGAAMSPPFGGHGGFPADFIAEGVDQTRGWFYTLHAIATMCFDSVAYKNVVSNGLVLDKLGRKMSKRWGNGVDPFATIEQHGADVTRWYMMTNSQPWDNLKFDPDGLTETRNKFFGTLYNTYNFFAIYANVDGFVTSEFDRVPYEELAELDKWIISKLNSLVQDVTQLYAEYEPTQAGRLIEEFVDAHLSNWYVRLARKRFWRGEMTQDKKAAYETLQQCLVQIAQLMSPIAPFFGDWLYRNITPTVLPLRGTEGVTEGVISVHLSILAKAETQFINAELEQRMDYAQRISSLVLSLRKAEKIRVRQPLGRILLPVLDSHFQTQVQAVQDLIMQEVNIKTIEFISDTSGVVSKKVKPNFKVLGKKLGKNMAAAKNVLENLSQNDIAALETQKVYVLTIENETIDILLEEVEILSDQIPGWSVQNDGAITVALDTHISDDLRAEGTARELVNRIQTLRKSRDFNVTDRIHVTLQPHESINAAITQFGTYIKQETLADTLTMTETVGNGELIELLDGVSLWLGAEIA